MISISGSTTARSPSRSSYRAAATDCCGTTTPTPAWHTCADFRRLVDRRVEQRIDIAIPAAVKLPNRDINPALPDEGGCSVRREGFNVPDAGGVHMSESFSNCGIRLWIDGRLVMDHWRQGWLPWLEIARVPLEAGRRHALKLEWSRDEGMPTG